jgi:hypothetical protein
MVSVSREGTCFCIRTVEMWKIGSFGMIVVNDVHVLLSGFCVQCSMVVLVERVGFSGYGRASSIVDFPKENVM